METHTGLLSEDPSPDWLCPTEDRGDGDLWPFAALLWLASVGRVAAALLHEETFGAEATLALVCVLLIPWLALTARRHRSVPRHRTASADPATPRE